MSYSFSSESGSYGITKKDQSKRMKKSINEPDCLLFDSEIRISPSGVILNRILS